MDRPDKIAFIDTETTGLGPLNRPWEIAVILRYGQDPDGQQPADIEHLLQVEYDWYDLPDGTDMRALWVGGWKDRGRRGNQAAHQYRERLIEEGVATAAGAEWSIARRLHRLLDGATVVGIGTHYDTETIGRMFLRHGLPWQPWHYGIVDLKTAGWGVMRGSRAPSQRGATGDWDRIPVKSEEIAEALGVEPPTDEERHTALGDARWARRWFDAL